MSKNDIYEISGRVKNHIASEDIALSPVGTILVNYFTLMLKDLYDLSENMMPPDREALNDLLSYNEQIPLLIIKAATSSDENSKYKTLYQKVEELTEQFNGPEDALDSLIQEYFDLGGDEFWEEAESATMLTNNHRKIMSLSRSIQMLKHLIGKRNA